MKPESRLIARVHSHLSIVHKEKMHNTFRGGTPDVFYCGDKASLWIEYKWLPKTPKRSFSDGLSPLQKEWLYCRAKEKVKVCVAIGCPDGISAFWNGQIFTADRTAVTFHRSLHIVKEFASMIYSIVGDKHALTCEESSIFSKDHEQI